MLPLIIGLIAASSEFSPSSAAPSQVRGMYQVAAQRQDPCLPFDMPPRDTFFSSSRKTFAFYFNIFPISLDNKAPSTDYYNTHWLQSIEGDEWQRNGGFLRSRPLPTTPSLTANFTTGNYEREVRLALDRGITGFNYELTSADCQNTNASKNGCLSSLEEMLTAAYNVDPKFRITLMPDDGMSIDQIITVVKAVYNRSNVYKKDGRLVVGIFRAETREPEEWTNLSQTLQESGYPIYLEPTFLSFSTKLASTYATSADAFGVFATATRSSEQREAVNADIAHTLGKSYMAGITPQNFRPKAYKYWESANSSAFRDGWNAAISGAADSVQLATWNDFSETTQVEPYTDNTLAGDIGTGFYDLTGYFATWFATGAPPIINHDVLYYFYRKQPAGAIAANAGRQMKIATRDSNPDQIELVAFLQKPGTISINIGSKLYTDNVGSGIHVLTAPLVSGQPTFSLSRKNHKVMTFTGKISIADEGELTRGYADLTYWSGSASVDGTCTISIP